MLETTRANMHISRAISLWVDSQKVLAEAQRFEEAGEVDENGLHPGDSDEVERLLKVFSRLLLKSRKHRLKAQALIDKAKETQ